MVYYQCAAGGQFHGPREGIFDLVFNLKTGKQRHRVLVVFELDQVMWHYLVHKAAGAFEDVNFINKDFLDIAF